MLKIGIVGCGYWGANLIRNLADLHGVKLMCVCDLDEKRLAATLKKYPNVEATTDYRAMLAMPGLEAVCIATFVSTHFDLAKLALEAGKHVLVEKPMTATVAEARELVELAAKKKRVLMVDHTFIYTGAVQKIKHLIDAGDLGDIHYYDSVRVNLGLFQRDVNALWDLAIHDLSILDYLLPQKARRVSATGVCHVANHFENIAYMTVFFDDNIIAHVHTNWLAPFKVRRTLIGGSRKMVCYDDTEPSEKITVYDKGVHHANTVDNVSQMPISYRAGEALSPKIDLAEPLAKELLHFRDCIRESVKPLTGGDAGLRTVEILEAANTSMKYHGQPVELR